MRVRLSVDSCRGEVFTRFLMVLRSFGQSCMHNMITPKLLVILLIFCYYHSTAALHIGTPPYLTEGLFHSILVATREEWTSTFGDDPHKFGALHVWIKCLIAEQEVLQLRAYVFPEPYDVDFGHDAAYSVVNVSYGPLILTVDGKPPKEQRHSPMWGGHFVTNKRAASVPTAFEVVSVGVAGWGSYFEFPLRLCALPSQKRQNATQRIMHSLQWDLSTSNQGAISHPINTSTFAAAVRRHALFHACYAGITTYELVVQESSIPLFLESSDFEQIVRTGLVHFILKPPLPSFRHGKGLRWQALYQNLAILRHWGNNVRLFMFDPDEFLFADDIEEDLNWRLEKTSVLVFERFNVVCFDEVDQQPDVFKPFSNKWIQVLKPLATKLAIDPSGTWEVYVHHAIPMKQNMSTRVTDNKLRVLHFPNFYGKRSRVPFEKHEHFEQELVMASVFRQCDPFK